jgi:hypothetical protein
VSAAIYCLLDDCSGSRATVVSVHDSEDEAHAARARGGAGMSQVGAASADMGTPTVGERVWFRGEVSRGETGVVTGRGVTS